MGIGIGKGIRWGFRLNWIARKVGLGEWVNLEVGFFSMVSDGLAR